MEKEALHRVLQVVLMAALGLLAALVAGFFLVRSVMADPKTMSLALRVSAERTTVFVRETDRTQFFRKVNMMTKPGKGPDVSGIPTGERYEFAALSEANDSGAGWVTYVWQDDGTKHVTVASADDPLLFLKPEERGESLGARSPLLRHKRTENVLWMRSASLPLPASALTTVIRAALGHESELLSESHATGGTLLIAATSPKQSTATRSIAGAIPGDALLRLEIGHPEHAVERIAKELRATDPALTEGMQGILQALLLDYTDRTDLKAAMNDVLAGPVSIAIVPAKNATNFVVSGTARSADATRDWLTALSGEGDTGQVRRVSFFKNENVRIDVTATHEDGVRETGTYKGWTLMELGSTGSALRLFVATQGVRYVASDETSLVTSVIDNPGTQVTWAGTANLNWLATRLRAKAPFLVPGSADAVRLLGAKTSHVDWKATPEAAGTRIDWSVR